jgi:hypothetical protein
MVVLDEHNAEPEIQTAMITAFELAGLIAAHAIWCVSGGETLIPMLAFTDENEGRHMERLDLEQFRHLDRRIVMPS